MPSKLYQELSNNSGQNTPNNPLLMQMAKNNPTLQQVLNELSNYKGTARSLFYEKARQKGIDPNYILNQLTK